MTLKGLCVTGSFSMVVYFAGSALNFAGQPPQQNFTVVSFTWRAIGLPIEPIDSFVTGQTTFLPWAMAPPAAREMAKRAVAPERRSRLVLIIVVPVSLIDGSSRGTLSGATGLGT